jgi:calcium permeable stress-gated cation channel
LESAELALLRKAAKIRRKQLKKGEKFEKGSAPEELEANDVNLADQLVPRKKRPTHRIKPGFLPFGLPFIGKEVDSIDWAKLEIVRLTKELNEGRAVLESEDQRFSDGDASKKSLTYPPVNSAFILFNNQMAAHMAVQTLTHHAPYRMGGKYIETAPADVIWGNLGLNPYEIKVRLAISYAATAALIIFWAIPVAAVGTISAAVANCSVKPLAWLCSLPDVVKGLIQGVLPAVLLAVLNLLLPIILRLLARFEGIPRKTGLELSLMTRFFIFQVVVGVSLSLFQIVWILSPFSTTS